MTRANIDKLIDIYFKTKSELNDLNRKRMGYENFCQFNENTGLGKRFRIVSKKIKICERLIKK